MKVCKVKPDYNVCCSCIDYQIDNHIVLNCDHCSERDKTDYEIVEEGHTFFYGDYVIVNKDGIKIKLKKKRVYDIRECVE